MLDKLRRLAPGKLIVNLFGAAGYSLLISVYAIIASVLLIWLVQGGMLSGIGIPTDAMNPPQFEITNDADASSSTTSLVARIFANIIAAFMAVTVLFVTISLPYWLGKIGSRLLKRAIRFFQWPVTPMSLLVAKFISSGLATVPILVYGTQDIGNIMLMISLLIFVILAFGAFLLQHYFAKMSNLEAKEIW